MLKPTVIYGHETWPTTKGRVILNTWKRNMLRKAYAPKHNMGFAEIK
jgi:hypothetical protein